MPSRQNHILFLTLRVFSATGGIEKLCRIAGKALFDISRQNDLRINLYSLYDGQDEATGNRYFPSEMFRGFNRRRFQFIRRAIACGKRSGTVIISHINLLPVAWMIKKWSPSTRVIMLAHGIEVWQPFSAWRRTMLSSCDTIACVSSYTQDKLRTVHQVPAEQLTVLNNCLDPYLPTPGSVLSREECRKKYGFEKDEQVLFTLTRLSSAEQYKGYEQVILALAGLKESLTSVRYVLAGKYDEQEKAKLDALIGSNGLKDTVQLTGYLTDEEVIEYFTLADLYIMPSRGEGFGIVFIEAMYYGLPVIAGNQDGSVDALLNGELGILLDPNNIQSIREAILNMLKNRETCIPDRQVLLQHFSYEAYLRRFQKIVLPGKN